jgi:hypothetical protein
VTAAELTRLLGGQWRGRGHGSYGVARCPAHDDGNPSLSIRDGNGERGPILKCFAGCDWRNIRDELRPLMRARIVQPVLAFAWARAPASRMRHSCVTSHPQ